MASSSLPSPLAGAALAALAFGLPAAAQTDAATLPPVTITARPAPAPAEVAGFGDLPPERVPLQTLAIGEARLKDLGAQGLRELARMDASVADAYNSVGYWDSLTVRGFVIDQHYNYRRDGLPFTGQTAIPLDNKSRLELLKGTSGIQAGTSAPGGLVNAVVKRPDTDLRSVTLALRGAANVQASADLSTRFGSERRYGLRLNVAAERLDPELKHARGERHLLALAGDWRIAPDTLIEAEGEIARRSQPSQPAFSLLGDRVPDARAIDPRINLGHQPWSQPVVFAGRTASLRLTQKLSPDWRAVLHGGTQRLITDDRLAFPYGCDAEGNYDRYCSDGSFDLYDYRSENERRRIDALDASLHGQLQTGALTHALSFGVLRSRYRQALQDQAFNPVGTGHIDGSGITSPDPTLTDTNTNRDERSTELYVRNAVQFGPKLGLWLGLRHTRLDRASMQTDGSEATRYPQNFTTPWLGASWSPAPEAGMFYASWGRGVESEVVPGLPDEYVDSGRALPARESHQIELGYKLVRADYEAGITLFEIEQPASSEIEVMTLEGLRTQIVADGVRVHRGIELNAQARLGAWTLAGSVQGLRARREGSADGGLNGSRPTNVPARGLRLMATHQFAALPGLATYAALTAESDRTLVPGDRTLRIPGWARVDMGARYDQRLADGQRLVWRAGIDNLANRRAWQESPHQFGHVYLYPMAPRTWRLSLQADL